MQMLSGVITEGEYKAKLQENKKPKSKKSLKENFVGMGAINNPFAKREKTGYETAFEHFLGSKYELKEEMEEVEEAEVEEVREEDEYINIGLTDLADVGYKAGEKAFEEIKTKFKNKPDFESFKKGYFQGFTDNAGSYDLNEDELEEGKEVEEPNNY
jgi:hypothetical protein